MIENEFKYLVSEENFKRLQELIRNKYPHSLSLFIHQTNYYYDTSDFYLHKNKITLRARAIDNKIEMQFKRSEKVTGQDKKSTEFHRYLENIPKTIPSSFIPADITEDANLLGSLTTERTSFQISNEVRIDFDKNNYLGITDYEIEIEYENELPQNVIDCIAQGLTLYKPDGKYLRFLNAYIKQKSMVTVYG
jgi:uncharacterized protein YjbK